MTSMADKNSEFLLALSADLTNAYDVAVGYFIGLCFQSYIKSKRYDFTEPVRNAKLLCFLDDCNLPNNLPAGVHWDWGIAAFMDDDGNPDYFYNNLERFYDLIHDLEDSQRFFSSVGYGYIVQDWEAFHNLYKNKKNASFFEALAVAICLRINQVCYQIRLIAVYSQRSRL